MGISAQRGTVETTEVVASAVTFGLHGGALVEHVVREL